MESDVSPHSPPAGWALNHDVPPGYEKKKPRPGTALWIVYLVLFAVGVILNLFGQWVSSQSTSWTTAALNPVAQFHSGQVISAVGGIVMWVSLGFAIAALAMGFGRRHSTEDSPSSGTSGP